MNPNWESLIRAIVPLSFMAIWALTSLFNRDTKPKPTPRPALRPDGSRAGVAARAGEPTLRFGSPTGGSTTPLGARRPAPRQSDDDGIVILSSETSRLDRDREQRLIPTSTTAKRASRGKPLVPQRKAEPAPRRAKLAGVSQNVNQHLTTTNLELTPLATMPPVASLGLAGAGSAAAVVVQSGIQTGGGVRPSVGLGLSDPARLREAFVLNEILQPPVSMRARRIGPTPM